MLKYIRVEEFRANLSPTFELITNLDVKIQSSNQNVLQNYVKSVFDKNLCNF